MQNYVDIENLSIVKNKLDLYRREEKEKITDFISMFSDINSNIKISNSMELEKIQNEFISKMKLLQRLHTNDVMVLDETINKYRTTADTVVKNFEDLR